MIFIISSLIIWKTIIGKVKGTEMYGKILLKQTQGVKKKMNTLIKLVKTFN